jgi:hypothetical protein
MGCCDNNCNKNINYCVGPLNGDEDFGTLTASDGINTSKIYDACGNLRIDLGCVDCDGSVVCGDIVRDCGGTEIVVVALIEKATSAVIPFVGCDQINAIKRAGNASCWQVKTDDGRRLNLNSITCCKRVCEDLPTTIEGGLVVNGDLETNDITANDITAKNITADEFIGNGCGITNTDNQEVDEFYHDLVDEELVLTTINTKDCPGMPNTPKRWAVDVKPFTHNTKNEFFGFEPSGSNNLVLRDTDGDELSVSLDKFDTYIADGNCTDDGIISLDYNPSSPLYPQQVIVDISNAVHTIESAEYDPCKGEMLLCHDNGECVLMDNLPVNVDVAGEIPLGPEWSGKVFYHIRSNVIMVSVNVQLTAFTTFPPGAFMPIELGRLPVKLYDYIDTDNLAVDTYTYKYLVSHSAMSTGFINHVQLGISIDGIMRITQWQTPERIQDSFCLVISEIDDSVTGGICPAPPSVTYTIRYYSNNSLMEVMTVTVTGDKCLVESNPFIYKNWEFLLWNTMPDRSGDSYKPNFYIKLTGDMDLYAIWKQVKFVVTYDANNGTGEFVQFEFYPGAIVLGSMFPSPLGTTFTFAEWNTELDGSGTTYNPGSLLNVARDITLYSIWR